MVVRRQWPSETTKPASQNGLKQIGCGKGIVEYLLAGGSGSGDTKLLEVRVFDKKVARAAYQKQTQAVQGKNKSNCPLCAVGNNANKNRVYAFDEMDADHVSAWSKGGGSAAANCQMLCTTHNRAKGNR